MKKARVLCFVLCIVFAFSVMLTACTKPVETTPTPTPAVSTAAPTPAAPTEVPKPKEIHLTKTFYFGDSTEYLTEKKAFADWLTDRYGIKFVMHYPARNNYLEVINLAAVSGDLIGLVQLFSAQDCNQWAKEGLLLPLTEYLKDNEVWATVPQEWKETYTFDGELWGIAQGGDHVPTYFARAIRGDWLANLGLKLPETIDDFYQAAYQFTFNDPDQNGLNDTIGFTSRNTWLMQDFFFAFDARVNHVGSAQPIYHPNKEIWEDSVIKPEMAECLAWLKRCYDEGIMDPETFTASSNVIRDRVSNGYAGGLFYWDSWINSFEANVQKIVPTAWMEGIGALKGKETTKLNFYGLNYGTPWGLMKNTPEPKEVANWYVNIFYGSVEGVYIGRLGIMGMLRGEGYFTLEGNKLYRNYFMNTTTGLPAGYPAPGLVGGHPEYRLFAQIEHIYNSPDKAWNDEQTAINAYRQKKLLDIFNKYNDLGLLYYIPESLKEPVNDLWLTIRGDQEKAAAEAIATSVTGSASIEDAIAKYKTIAKTLGVLDVLKAANDKLGKATTQNYN
jgi:putative aldouronate transport system substrate-binding protein